MYTLPINTILTGLLDVMGITHPATKPPVGVLRVFNQNGVAIEESNINGWGFGPWESNAENPEELLPFVHIEFGEDVARPDGPFGMEIDMPLRVYYVCPKVLDSDLSPNPYVVAQMRAKALQNLVQAAWKRLGTNIVLNAIVGTVTASNEWQEWNESYNKLRIAYSFDVMARPREVFPEVLV